MAQHDPLSLLLSFDVGADEEWLCHYPLAGKPLQEALPAEAVHGTRYALTAMVLASSVNSGNGFDFRKDELQEMLGGIIDHDTNKLNVRTEFTEGYNYRVRKER
jgi:hypothetical protein